jgi:biopolymer transport protein ExbD
MKLSSHKLSRDSRPELSMTSMIDVVFLLLIFFMTTSSFLKTERDLDSGIQVERRSGERRGDFEPAIVDVVRSEGRFVFRLGGREFLSQREPTGVLRQFENKADGAFVRVSDEVPFDRAAAAIQACRSARFVSVSYVPLETER